MKVRLTATDKLEAWLEENKSIIGFEHSEVLGDGYSKFFDIDLATHADFYKLICNLASVEDLVILSADESECAIEIYNGYRE